ncbi:hypothetical protein M5C99_17535 [Acidovorax sp. NCPPB 2350]|nr:hypothetical protein M5C99_17535 [Acidovorax sp. NCPPB 2350]
MQRTNHALARLAAALLIGGALAGAAAAAQDTVEPSQTPAGSARAKAAKKSVKIHNGAPNHSGETPAERDRRLYRECRGLPNAGACLGYARR